MDKLYISNASSEFYYSQNWFRVQTINDTIMTKVDAISNEENPNIANLSAYESTIFTSMKTEDLNNPSATRNVSEVGNTQNLCYLCDCKTGDNVPCNINANEKYNRDEGMLFEMIYPVLF